MSKIPHVMLAALLVSGNALAADASSSTSTGTTTAASADLDAQLAAARQKLEAAARDVAQLSAQLGQSAMVRVRAMGSHAVLGLQLDTGPNAKTQGATVIGVSPGGPAAEAGLAAGDVIVALNGEPTTGQNATREVVTRMAAVKPDSKVAVRVMRDGKPKEFQVMARAGAMDFFTGFNGPGAGWGPAQWMNNPSTPPFQMPPDRVGAGTGALFDGMELADLSPALGQYFGTSQGVLVVRVPHDGDFLKLQDGDVIESIDGRVPENGSHATRILRSYQAGEKIHLKVMRQKKAVELEGSLPQRGRFGPRAGPDRGPGMRGPRPGEPPPGEQPPPA